MSDPSPSPEQRLSITKAGDLELTLVGEIDPHTAPLLAKAVDDVLAALSEADLLLDMTDVTFVDSSGLRVLANAQRTLDESSRELVLRSPSNGVKTLLKVTGLGDFVRVE